MVLGYHLLLLLILLPSTYGADSIGEFCTGDKNLTTAQSSNVARTLEELVARTPGTGFATSSFGSGDQKAYGLAQCRGDVSTEDCSSCVADAAKRLPKDCPNRNGARIWFDYCFLRYGTENFMGQLDTGYGIFYYNVNDINTTNPDSFDTQVGDLMNHVRRQALIPKNRGLGKDQTQFSSFVTIYGLVQCNGDLSQLLCDQCLAIAIGKLPDFCQHKVGCQAIYSSCKIRYEIYPFFFPLEPVGRSRGFNRKVIVHP
ncbi:cysteine-rich repeat secretory protein 55-like [Aristolochia californica]|uniref:cysteine-rich repeat secretory protein 55-like n=1 Tax=Aristolochia californica TaxID=171875 RepID=UPI0035E16E04